MSLVVEMLSASLRIVATRSTVGKAENSSGLWIQSATIRMRTASAMESASPKSIMNAGTGRGEQAQDKDDADGEGDVLAAACAPLSPRERGRG
jgi:hypothetical protein